MNLANYLPRITWEPEPTELKEQLAEMIEAWIELNSINQGLNQSIGHLMRQIENLRVEAHTVLAAITLQHGGDLLIKADFFEALKSQHSSKLSIKKEEDESVHLTIEHIEEEEDCDAEEKGCKTC